MQRDELARRINDELRRQAPEIKLSTPSAERDLIRLDGYGVVWVEEFKDGRFCLAIQDERGTNDWGAALDKRTHLDPTIPETVESAVAEALAFLVPPNARDPGD